MQGQVFFIGLVSGILVFLGLMIFVGVKEFKKFRRLSKVKYLVRKVIFHHFETLGYRDKLQYFYPINDIQVDERVGGNKVMLDVSICIHGLMVKQNVSDIIREELNSKLKGLYDGVELHIVQSNLFEV